MCYCFSFSFYLCTRIRATGYIVAWFLDANHNCCKKKVYHSMTVRLARRPVVLMRYIDEAGETLNSDSYAQSYTVTRPASSLLIDLFRSTVTSTPQIWPSGRDCPPLKPTTPPRQTATVSPSSTAKLPSTIAGLADAGSQVIFLYLDRLYISHTTAGRFSELNVNTNISEKQPLSSSVGVHTALRQISRGVFPTF